MTTRYVPFSKRKQQALDGGETFTYQYDKAPLTLRRQVALILVAGLGDQTRLTNYLDGPTVAGRYWHYVFQFLRQEAGEFELHPDGGEPKNQVLNYILTADTDHFLDAVEQCLAVINVAARTLDDYEAQRSGIASDADETISSINYRFREHRFGYAFVPEANEIIRIDSEYIHKDAVERAFTLLHDEVFEGASHEFAEAHREYREGDPKDAIAKALKAFESTIKIICDRLKWPYDPKANAKGLIAVIFDNGLVAKSHESFFGALRSVMESGLPTVRNSTSGHGQGASVVKVPRHVAGFALHLAAASIVFLV
ncbi:MAG TPA: hypothetical protein VFH72_00355, partial [Candidatus Baltobacteraceae bacterium]|nr:hypothetical protein [Candidatus Baltobacteraceae bacterium]